MLALACVLGVGEGDLLHWKAQRVECEYFARTGSLFQSDPWNKTLFVPSKLATGDQVTVLVPELTPCLCALSPSCRFACFWPPAARSIKKTIPSSPQG